MRSSSEVVESIASSPEAAANERAAAERRLAEVLAQAAAEPRPMEAA